MPFFRLIRPFSLSIAAALALSACGGGGSDNDSPTAVTGAQTGVFVDSAVEGLSYETSSGVKGTTDAQGRFKYNEGDTVTFKLAGVTLGSGKATGTVTPAHISEGGEDSNKFTNLLVLLQSLDTDGDPANGITLPSSLDGSKIAKVAERLNDDPTDFTDDSKNAELKDASPQKSIRSREEARKHYEDTQAKTSDFLDGAAGVWEGADDAGRYVLLRLTPSGRYLLRVESEDGGEPDDGTEVGSLTHDAKTGLITTSDIKTDTNGTGGWSHLTADRTVTMTLAAAPETRNYTASLTVTLKTPEGLTVVAQLYHPEQRRDLLIGVWSTSPDLRINAPLVRFRNGLGTNYTYLAPEATSDTCGAGALEAGGYEQGISLGSVGDMQDSPSPSAQPTLTFTGLYRSNKGCQFFNAYGGIPLPMEVSQDALTVTVKNPEDGTVLFKLYRIKRDKDYFLEQWD